MADTTVSHDPVPCKGCGTVFTPTRKGNTFCTQRCWRKWKWNTQWRQKPLGPYKCVVCGTTFDQAREWQRYCSIRCRDAENRSLKAARKARPVTRDANRPFGSFVCGTCGYEFARTRWTQKFCSTKCSNLRKQRKWVGKNVVSGRCRSCPCLVIPTSKSFCEKHWYTQAAARSGIRGKGAWELVKRLLEAQDFKCPYTGRSLAIGVNASIDHKNPRSVFREGSGEWANIEWVDLEVNRMKRAMTKMEFIGMCKLISDRH